MMNCKTRSVLVGALYVVLVSMQASAQGSLWQKHMAAATRAHREGRYRDAEESLKAALKEAERFGAQDLRLAANLNDLAEAYRKQGKYTEAEPLYLRSLAIWKKALGLDHPSVAIGLNNLALLYTAQGKYAEAESLYLRSQAIWEKALGPDHLYVATNLENYASLLRKMNREAEAAKMETRAKAIRTKHARENATK
ncbi:MAG: tetratricopeptide repeat protein [Candidatus Binatia bacterium]